MAIFIIGSAGSGKSSIRKQIIQQATQDQVEYTIIDTDEVINPLGK